MKSILPTLKQAVWITGTVALVGVVSLGAFRLARSMQRGRGAAFSLENFADRPAGRVAFDWLSPGNSPRWTGLSATEAQEALRRCQGFPARFVSGQDRVAAVALLEDQRPVARRALHIASNGEAVFSLRVPKGATLTFFTGGRAEAGGKFEMTVELLAGGAPPTILDRRNILFVGGPAPLPGTMGRETTFKGLEADWRSVEADLSSWEGQWVSLRLKTLYRPDPNAPPGVSAHAFWGSPAVWTTDLPARPKTPRLPSARGANVLWVVFESFTGLLPERGSSEDFPGLDRLAREGVEFRQVYANRLEAEEGLWAMFTSEAPSTTGTLSPRPQRGKRDVEPLPELLRRAGYRTLLFGAPGNDPTLWCEAGFDVVRCAPPMGMAGESSLRETARWMGKNRGRGPHFLVAFVRQAGVKEDPSPRCWWKAAFQAPRSLIRVRPWRALAQRVQMDGALESLWNQTVRFGEEGHTLGVVNSLTGSSFRPEPVRLKKDGRLEGRVLPDMSLGMREEEIRVLWLMRHPALASGRKVRTPAQLLDVAPTIADLLEVPFRKNAEGRSFAGKNPRPEGSRFLIQGPAGDALILDGRYKYIRRAPSQELLVGWKVPARTDFEPEELYDLWTDPWEDRSLARRRRDLLARARRAVDEWGPERTAVRVSFRGWEGSTLQGVATCPGGDLWNVSLSSGSLKRGGSNQVSFTIDSGASSLSFETWPPPASFTLTVRSNRWGVPAEDYLVSALGLPLIETERRTDWYDANKFPWMEGIPENIPMEKRPRILLGRTPVPRDVPSPDSSLGDGGTLP